ncbi:hypothetical protein M8494_10425 [Serratia ureilytica]
MKALIRHPAVSLVAVIGVEHPSLGEEIKRWWCCPKGGRSHDRGRNADRLGRGGWRRTSITASFRFVERCR